ncbi:transmembrane domain-containing protein [Rufibacter sp. XAAS-G3-1]|uniref:EGFR-like transmembrane domain-containing protein n=1 Tax=Rufibacter sp. XAAS-G3-1 TaxID=2729134 RepID=UPI0015E70FA9|nr:transmembrane domain-containing protein [Rufibacter sp. XAAS-G3-1]
MGSMFLQVDTPNMMFRDFLEPIAGPLTIIVVVGAVVYSFMRRRSYNRKLYNAITRPTVIYQQVATPAPAVPVDGSPALSTEEFCRLPWEEREALYRNRIIELRDTNRRLRARMKEAGLPTD